MDYSVESALEIFRRNHFLNSLGVEVREENGKFYVEVEVSDVHLNPYGMVHGGMLYALSDSVVGLAVRAHGKKAVTLNASYNYLSNVSSGRIIATAETIRVGRTIAVMKSDVVNESGKLLSTGTFTYYLTE
ncbi:MAG: PaaI family thioesterase [Oscillospiraceae bacterium]|nr:PaaI family thioesterase [Oscillospiraceae bacterium]